MNAKEEELTRIVEFLLEVAKASPPQAFKAFLCGGVIANVISALPEDYFEQMLKVEPCGRLGCDCHLLHSPANDLFVDLREDHQRHGGMMDQDE